MDIQDAIKTRATKFLFVHSRHSNDKPGVLQELSLAKRIGKERHDFVIPLRIDDLSNDETNIELVRINSVDFSQGWTAGLARLLEKLEKDRVPKDPRFNPDAVASWWREQQRLLGGVKPVAETCASNWFKISDLPESIFLHSLEIPFTGEEKELPIGIPNYRYKGGFFCFEAASGPANGSFRGLPQKANSCSEIRIAKRSHVGCGREAIQIFRLREKSDANQ